VLQVFASSPRLSNSWEKAKRTSNSSTLHSVWKIKEAGGGVAEGKHLFFVLFVKI